MRVFITGSTGLLGSTLIRTAPKEVILGATYNKNSLVPNIACHYFPVDITKKTMVNRAIKSFKPDVVIHTAAIATPDYCDKHRKEAWAVNVVGTKNLLEACKKSNTLFVYITTNGVYDGKNPPYDESQTPNPLDYYGKTKYESEKLTKKSGLPYLIMRLITMYGWNNPDERQNPVTWLMEILGKNKTPINMVSDMFNNFLYVESAAEVIWKAILQGKVNEEYNIAGKECISRYDFSRKIAKTFMLDEKMIYPVTLNFFKNFVARPKNTCFITSKMEKDLQTKPLPILSGLKHMHNHQLSNSSWRKIT